MCGFQYNHRDLRWEMQWRGNKIEKTGFLVCPTCWDEPNPTLRPKVLPPDPVPILNPRAGDFNPQDILTEDSNPLITENNVYTMMTESEFMDVFARDILTETSEEMEAESGADLIAETESP